MTSAPPPPAPPILPQRAALETGAKRLSLDTARRSRASLDSRASLEFSRHSRGGSLDAASLARSSSSASSSMHRISSSGYSHGAGNGGAGNGGAGNGGSGLLGPQPVPGSPLAEEAGLPPSMVPLAGAVCTAERVSSALLGQLVKVQQALCVSDPTLPDCPIIHASQARPADRAPHPSLSVPRRATLFRSEGAGDTEAGADASASPFFRRRSWT